MIIDGKAIARRLLEALKAKPAPGKFFGAVLVGDDPASINFLKQKEKTGNELGIEFRLYRLPQDITSDNLRQEIGRLAGPKTCGGFIVQLPLPPHINKHYALNAIPKEKDVDVLSEKALGAFYTGRNPIAPPSVATVQELLALYKGNLRDAKIALVGAGFLIGKPVALWLQNRVGTIAMVGRDVADIHKRLADADIIISGAGQAHLFGGVHLKPGAMVIDFGFDTVDGKIAGDFDPTGGEEKGITYTPTPGGTGPILVAKLFENFYALQNTTDTKNPG